MFILWNIEEKKSVTSPLKAKRKQKNRTLNTVSKLV